MSIVTPDGGLTTLGYALCGICAVILVIAAGFLHEKSAPEKKMSAKQLAFCAAAMALSFVTSFIKVFSLPYGGSVTLFSMLFICLIGYWYGIGTGIMTGLAYGILQFAGLGLAGAFMKSKNGLVKGYILGILVRGAFHTLGGYLYWMDYMPENFPQSLSALYPIIYNYSYILAEGIITVIVISLPPVAKALSTVKKMATE